jgi:hypothetical protein
MQRFLKLFEPFLQWVYHCFLHLRHWGGKVGRGRLHARIAKDERFGLGLDRIWWCSRSGSVLEEGRW